MAGKWCEGHIRRWQYICTQQMKKLAHQILVEKVNKQKLISTLEEAQEFVVLGTLNPNAYQQKNR